MSKIDPMRNLYSQSNFYLEYLLILLITYSLYSLDSGMFMQSTYGNHSSILPYPPPSNFSQTYATYAYPPMHSLAYHPQQHPSTMDQTTPIQDGRGPILNSDVGGRLQLDSSTSLITTLNGRINDQNSVCSIKSCIENCSIYYADRCFTYIYINCWIMLCTELRWLLIISVYHWRWKGLESCIVTLSVYLNVLKWYIAVQWDKLEIWKNNSWRVEANFWGSHRYCFMSNAYTYKIEGLVPRVHNNIF